jgi:hypothetical protein
MLSYAVILAMVLAGYAAAPWWLVLPGAACLTLDGWWAQLCRMGREPRVAWSSKATTYFVTGAVLNIALAAFSFGAGGLARALLG